MDKATFNERITAIGTCEDDATRRTLLTELSEEVNTDYDALISANERIDELTKETERLQGENMKLFLKISDHTTSDDQQNTQGTQPRKYEDLFNDKGEIK